MDPTPELPQRKKPEHFYLRIAVPMEYFLNSSRLALDLYDEMNSWCRRQVSGEWYPEGGSIYSLYYLFSDTLDATAFKMKFGV